MICVRDGKRALAFYEAAFDAEVSNVMEFDGKLGHAEVRIGDRHLMLAEEFPEYHATSPTQLGGSPVTLYLQVADTDAATDKAIDAGAKLLRGPENAGHGERVAKIQDPAGHLWFLAGPLKD